MDQIKERKGTPQRLGNAGCPTMDAADGCTRNTLSEADVLGEFFDGFIQLAADARKKLGGKRTLSHGSRALAFAVEIGLPPKMAYTVKEVAEITGVSRSQLYKEHDAGRLKWIIPAGSSKGAVVSVEEIDRWMEESIG